MWITNICCQTSRAIQPVGFSQLRVPISTLKKTFELPFLAVTCAAKMFEVDCLLYVFFSMTSSRPISDTHEF